nr:MAG TPA: hypothetical protein [Caudoviricetes sp.]
MVRLARRGKVIMVSWVVARLVWLGLAWHCAAWFAGARLARLGELRRVLKWQGLAGKARFGGFRFAEVS